jgi:hypothetical protein
VLDDHSRYVTVLQTLESTRAELVREQLEQAFTDSDVPDGMLMDHVVPCGRKRRRWAQLG